MHLEHKVYVRSLAGPEASCLCFLYYFKRSCAAATQILEVVLSNMGHAVYYTTAPVPSAVIMSAGSLSEDKNGPLSPTVTTSLVSD